MLPDQLVLTFAVYTFRRGIWEWAPCLEASSKNGDWFARGVRLCFAVLDGRDLRVRSFLQIYVDYVRCIVLLRLFFAAGGKAHVASVSG